MILLRVKKSQRPIEGSDHIDKAASTRSRGRSFCTNDAPTKVTMPMSSLGPTGLGAFLACLRPLSRSRPEDPSFASSVVRRRSQRRGQEAQEQGLRKTPLTAPPARLPSARSRSELR